ncbi:MAG: lytic transglycosylase domain-containing protein [Dehalococcoidia bacterium]|nr:lytic transglycosylase domain-containing protein [Dehalococcoidia bacterium]
MNGDENVGLLMRSLYGESYKDYARQIAKQFGIPEDLFLAYFQLESGWNPLAVNPKSGAAGLGQIMPSNKWASELGVVGDRRFNPYSNIHAIAYELLSKYSKHGDWHKAFMYTGEGKPEYLQKLLSIAGRAAKPGGVDKSQIQQRIRMIEQELAAIDEAYPRTLIDYLAEVPGVVGKAAGAVVGAAPKVAETASKVAGAVSKVGETVAEVVPEPVRKTVTSMVTGVPSEVVGRLAAGVSGLRPLEVFKNRLEQLQRILQGQVAGPIDPTVPEASLLTGPATQDPLTATMVDFPIGVLRDLFVNFLEEAVPESKTEVVIKLPYYFGEGELPEGVGRSLEIYRNSIANLSGDLLEIMAFGPYLGALARGAAAIEAGASALPGLFRSGITRERILNAIRTFDTPRPALPSGPLEKAAAERQAVIEAFEAKSYPTEPLESKLTPTKLEPYLAADRAEKQAIIKQLESEPTPVKMERYLAADRAEKQAAIERLAKLMDEVEESGGLSKSSVDELLESAAGADAIRATAVEEVTRPRRIASPEESLRRIREADEAIDRFAKKMGLGSRSQLPGWLRDRPLTEVKESMQRMKMADEAVAQFARESGLEYSNQLPRWFRNLEELLGDESGWVGIRRPLPPQHVIARDIADLVEKGVDPKLALAEVSAKLGRSPKKVLSYLEEVSPAKIHTVGTVQGAALNEVVRPKLRDWVEAMVPEKHYTVDSVPKPFSFGPGAIDPKVPAAVRDVGSIEEFLASPNLWMNRVFGGSNNPVVDFFTGYLQYTNNRLMYEGWLKDLLKAHPGMLEDVTRSLHALESELKPVFIKYVSYLKNNNFEVKPKDPVLQSIYSERDAIVAGLSERFRNVRIKRAAEGDTHALALCNEEEKKLVKLTRDYYDLKKEQLKRQKVPVIERDYVNYIFLEGGDEVGATWWPGKQYHTPELLKFLSRDPGAKDWFPLWFQSMSAYIPVVEKKLAFNPVLGKWIPALDKMPSKVAAGIQRFFDSVMSPKNQTMLDSALNTLTNSAYFVTTFGNASIPTLHLFKLLQTPVWHGTVPYTKGMARLLKALPAETPEGHFVRTYIKLSQLISTLEQQLGYRRFFSPDFWRRSLGSRISAGAKSISYGPTIIVEAFDNGVNALAVLERGLKAGAEMGLIHREILETMLRLNFRSFDAPRLFRDYGATGRLLTMFQITPYKLLENKADLVIRALHGKKDAFGESYFNKLVRLIVYLGLPGVVAAHYGYDLTKHLLHPPFLAVSHLTGEWGLTAPPPIQLWAEASREGPEVLKTQLPWTVSAPTKWVRVSEGDIPEAYHGPISYLLGIPKTGWAEDLRQKREWQRHRRFQHTHRSLKRTPPLVEFMEDLFR